MKLTRGRLDATQANTFRATSKRTRIETEKRVPDQGDTETLSEQHPREQGLKPGIRDKIGGAVDSFRATSKRTRIETGRLETRKRPVPPFRATSKRTRIETRVPGRPSQTGRRLSEQHPREQGLKRFEPGRGRPRV